MIFRPRKCAFESGYANVEVKKSEHAVPITVIISEFASPRNTSPVCAIYLYALNDIVLGMRKNARSVSSFSVENEPATT